MEVIFYDFVRGTTATASKYGAMISKSMSIYVCEHERVNLDTQSLLVLKYIVEG